MKDFISRIGKALKGAVPHADSSRRNAGPYMEVIEIEGGGPFNWGDARFPQYKGDFTDGARGTSGYDLSNAARAGAVQTGDILKVTAAGYNGAPLLYLGPDQFSIGQHHFRDAEPYRGMPEGHIVCAISAWEKEGHVTPEEWAEKLRKIEAEE